MKDCLLNDSKFKVFRQEGEEGMEDNQVFHIHTYRCGHAEVVDDVEYVKRAIELGARKITFTDHAPFPGNPFGNRMKIEELDEYIETIKELREKFCEQIEVVCGLEIEYLPSFKTYYEELSNRNDLDILLLGQHFYQLPNGSFSFSLKREELFETEWNGCGEAIMEGMQTGYFSCVAHPDRIFRHQKDWKECHSEMSRKIIELAISKDICMEHNLSSLRQKGHFRREFWELVQPGAKTIVGCDAHSVDEIKLPVFPKTRQDGHCHH